MEKFCKDLKEHATKIINYEKKEIIPLTDEENDSYKKQKVCYICKKEFNTDKNEKNAFKLYRKVRDHCHYTEKYRGAAHNVRYKISKEIPIVFHNVFTYNYHFVIKEPSKKLRVNLNAWEKIQRTMVLFHYHDDDSLDGERARTK